MPLVWLSPPKGSRPPSSSTSWPTWAATPPRVSCSPGPSHRRTWRPSPASRIHRPRRSTERARRRSVREALLQSLELVAQLVGQMVAEEGEVLLDGGHLGPPLV